jgi:hypothetical protein
MTDSETLDKAKALFTGQTQGDLLAREVITIAERAIAINASATCLYCEQTMPKTEVWAHVRKCLEERRAP